MNINTNRILILIFMILIFQTSCAGPKNNPTPSKTAIVSTAAPTGAPLPTTITSEDKATTTTLESNKVTLIIEGHNLEWLECKVPETLYLQPYFAQNCLGIEKPTIDSNNILVQAERIETPSLSDLKLVVRDDIYETKHESLEGRFVKYQLYKNNNPIVSATVQVTAFESNRSLFTYKDNIVWELADAENPTVFVNDINLRDKNDFDALYFPYILDGKLIYTAQNEGRFFIVYDGDVIGPDFDEIHIAYCCWPALYSIHRANNMYWFRGIRDNNHYIVVIKEITES